MTFSNERRNTREEIQMQPEIGEKFKKPPSSKNTGFLDRDEGASHHSLKRADEPLARSSPSNLKAAHAV